MAAQWSCCKRNAADAEQSCFFFCFFGCFGWLVGVFFFFFFFFFLSVGSSKLSQSGGAQGRLQTVARTLIDSICGTNFSFYQLDHSFRFVGVLLLVYTVLILFIFWIYGRRFFFFF